MNGNWVEAGRSEAIEEGAAIEWVSGKEILAIFRDDGQLFAIDGVDHAAST